MNRMRARGPYGVGVGLQATEVVADATVTQGQSARGLHVGNASRGVESQRQGT